MRPEVARRDLPRDVTDPSPGTEDQDALTLLQSAVFL